MKLFEKQISSKKVYEGKIINLRVDEVLLENGKTALREVIEHNGAVAVVAIDENNMVYMVKQFRYPFNEVMLEIPAGKLEKGEMPIDAVARELEEEAGIKADEYIFIGEFLPSVAILTEKIHLYFAKGIHQSKQNLDEDEFINIEKIHIDRLVDMIMSGEIKDGKSIAAILKAKRLIG